MLSNSPENFLISSVYFSRDSLLRASRRTIRVCPMPFPSMWIKAMSWSVSPSLNFLTVDLSGQPIPHPWHPNIRYFGAFAGKVCINMADTYTDLLWGVERVASYLRYDTYHAIMEPPYPEDLKVAAWVRHQGEPNGWIYFEQKTN